MKTTTLTSIDMQIDVSGPNSPYSITWSTSFSNNTFTVKFSSEPPIVGGLGETLTLYLLNVEAFKSEHLIPMSSPLSYSYPFSALDPSAGTESGGKGASYTFLLTILLSIGVSLLTGGSMELMWSLANTLQLLFFFALLHLHYSSDLKTVFGYMRYSNFENPLTDFVVDGIKKGFAFIESPVDAQFADLGFSSTNILLNSFDKLLLVFLLLSSGVGLAVLVYLCRKKDSKIVKLIRRVDKSVRYESLTRFFVELMLNITVASLINITYGMSHKVEEVISYSIA